MKVSCSFLHLAILCLVTYGQVVSGQSAMAQDRSLIERRQDQFSERRNTTLNSLRHELSELSQSCHDQGLRRAAQDITAISLELTATDQEPNLSTMVQLPISDRLPKEERLWRTRLQELRIDRAKELYSLARKALTAANLPSLAYGLIKDTLRLDPDHVNARAVLGLKLFKDPLRLEDPTYAGEWVSPFEARKRSGSQPEVNHPVFGWIPVRHVERYEQGERLWRSKWVSAAKEEELRRDFRNAWEIQTEHFLVKTNTRLEEGVEVSRKLEMFHKWLTTEFTAFFETPKSLRQRFEDAHAMRRGGKPPEPMEVHYYATRTEYERTVRAQNQQIGSNVSNGLYLEDTSTCYFFRDPEDKDLDVVYHEATHQIFDLATVGDRRSAELRLKSVLRRSRTVDWVLCENTNFWMVEGIACYFESIVMQGGQITVGRPDYARFVTAHRRMLSNDPEVFYYMPLQAFSSLGFNDFKQHPNLRQLYTQAAGVSHFLMHYGNGIYRDNFVTLLSAAYRPDLKDITSEPSLEEITGVKFAVLDQQYREHMENIAIQAAKAAAAAAAQNNGN